MVEALRTDFSVRQICETLGFTRSNLYYHPKQDLCEAGLRDEIEKLSLLYPTYGYRRITQLLVRSGYTIGYKRVARLMKSVNLSVSVKRVCQTTTSVEGVRPWGNRLENLDVSRCDQVWVGRYYLRPSQRTLHLCMSAHGCLHSHDQRRPAYQSTLDAISDVETLRDSIMSKCPRDPSF